MIKMPLEIVILITVLWAYCDFEQRFQDGYFYVENATKFPNEK